jgi:enoyl-[acyl-carrier-protein] reductase (NADH)
MAAHVRSLLVLAQTASPSMSENGGGAIVAISSLGARRVYDAYAAFGTAKAAIETLITYLAVEGGPKGIRPIASAAASSSRTCSRKSPSGKRSPRRRGRSPRWGGRSTPTRSASRPPSSSPRRRGW